MWCFVFLFSMFYEMNWKEKGAIFWQNGKCHHLNPLYLIVLCMLMQTDCIETDHCLGESAQP